jgi:hypothetical protein
MDVSTARLTHCLHLSVQTHQGALDNLENVYIKKGGAQCVRQKTPSKGGQVYLHQVITQQLCSMLHTAAAWICPFLPLKQ